MIYAVGCDIGGTNCKVGLINSNGGVEDHLSFRVDHGAGINRFLSTLCDSIDFLAKGRDLQGIGVLLPGYLKENRTVPYIMVNIPMLEDVPLHGFLKERYGVTIALDIDRNGPCLAEYIFHYKGKFSRLMYVTIGTGVGVGLVVEGVICRICNDSIGELGHVTLEPGGHLCVCGNTGCVETIVSKDGIGRIAERLGLASSILKADETGLLSPGDIYEEALKGNEAALQVFKEFGRYLGAALVTYANTFSPDIIVVGGGLAGASEFFLKTADEFLNKHWFERKAKRIPVKKTRFGAHAGIIGAASLVIGNG